ncbi:MAG TPA: glycine cleavage system protein H [Terriglobia bacterium]|nr:glycine cleavage system protein H [Terriglobia bacterium]
MPEYLETTVDKFTFRVAKGRFYTPEGAWVDARESGGPLNVRLGVTDYFQQHNGDVAFVTVKPPGTSLDSGNEFAEIESMKVTLELPSPVTGAIVEVNKALETNPKLVNQDPYGQGWLARVEPTGWETDRAKLLDADAYLAIVQAQAEEELKS